MEADKKYCERSGRETSSRLCFSAIVLKIYRIALNDKIAEIVLGCTVINDVRYANDTVLLVTNIENLQEPVSSVVKHTIHEFKAQCKENKWFIVSRTKSESRK